MVTIIIIHDITEFTKIIIMYYNIKIILRLKFILCYNLYNCAVIISYGSKYGLIQTPISRRKNLKYNLVTRMVKINIELIKNPSNTNALKSCFLIINYL